jgi:hypothetical protein
MLLIIICIFLIYVYIYTQNIVSFLFIMDYVYISLLAIWDELIHDKTDKTTFETEYKLSSAVNYVIEIIINK